MIINFSMFVCFVYVLYYLPGREKKWYIKVSLQEKEYNWEISYQIKKIICFNIN